MVLRSSLRWHMIISTPTSPSVIRYQTVLKNRLAFGRLHPTARPFPSRLTDLASDCLSDRSARRGERSLLRWERRLRRARALGLESAEWREERSFSEGLQAAEALFSQRYSWYCWVCWVRCDCEEAMLVERQCYFAQLAGRTRVRQLACRGVTLFRSATTCTNSSACRSGRQSFSASRKTSCSSSADSVRRGLALMSLSVAALTLRGGLQVLMALGNHRSTRRKVITSSLLKTGSRTSSTSLRSSSLFASLVSTRATNRSRSLPQLSRLSTHHRSSPSLEMRAKGTLSKSYRELSVSRLFWVGRGDTCLAMSGKSTSSWGCGWQVLAGFSSSDRSILPAYYMNTPYLTNPLLLLPSLLPPLLLPSRRTLFPGSIQWAAGFVCADILLQEMGKEAELTPEQVQRLKEKRKEQKKRRKENQREMSKQREVIRQSLEQAKQEEAETVEAVDIIEENQNILTGKYYDYFKTVFQKHQERARKYFDLEEDEQAEAKPDAEGDPDAEGEQGAAAEAKPAEEKMSRSQRKKMRWLKVADLKARAKRPDLVEAWDITAPDPLFLCELKTLKNTIPVPRHWNQKSKFLQTKRGVLKPMFKLPEFIEATGISKLRDPFSERDGSKMVREKLKERMNPKLGKIDIEYSVLHDAFFKYQTKSELTVFGDTFYEGKEDESKARQFKPGLVSEALRMALGISDYQAPPWIINMQRYGAPPSYPTLRILGSNIPFSQVASYSIINKQGLEEVARKLGQPGLYATFRTYYEEEEEEFVDKGYWGQITNLDEVNDEMEEEWQQQDEDDA